MTRLSQLYRRLAVGIPEIARPRAARRLARDATVRWFPDPDIRFPVALVPQSPAAGARPRGTLSADQAARLSAIADLIGAMPASALPGDDAPHAGVPHAPASIGVPRAGGAGPAVLADGSVPSAGEPTREPRRSCTVVEFPDSLSAMVPFLRQSLVSLLCAEPDADLDAADLARLRRRFFAPLRLAPPPADPETEPVLYVTGEALCREGSGRWVVDADLLARSARTLADAPLQPADLDDIEASATRDCSVCIVDCTGRNARVLSLATAFGMMQWTMAYREGFKNLIILVDRPDGAADVGRDLVDRIRRGGFPGMEHADARVLALEPIADATALDRFADVWWQWFGMGGVSDGFRHELDYLVRQFDLMPSAAATAGPDTDGGSAGGAAAANRMTAVDGAGRADGGADAAPGPDDGASRAERRAAAAAGGDILLTFASLLCDGVYVDDLYEFVEAMDARLLRGGERRELYAAVTRLLHGYRADNAAGPSGAPGFGRRWRACRTEAERWAQAADEPAGTPERRPFPRYLDCRLQELPRTALYRERAVLSPFSLCFLAKAVVDATYETGDGAAVPVDVVAMLTNDLSSEQWLTLVRYVLRMMLGVKSQQREGQARLLLEACYRALTAGDGRRRNGFDEAERRDGRLVAPALVELSLECDMNLSGRWLAMWRDFFLHGLTGRRQPRTIEAVRREARLVPGNLRALRRMAEACFADACARYGRSGDAADLAEVQNAVWMELVARDGDGAAAEVADELRRALRDVDADGCDGGAGGVGGAESDGGAGAGLGGWGRRLHAIHLIDLAAWSAREGIDLPYRMPRAVVRACLTDARYVDAVLAALAVGGSGDGEDDAAPDPWSRALYAAAAGPFRQLVLRGMFAADPGRLDAVLAGACNRLAGLRVADGVVVEPTAALAAMSVLASALYAQADAASAGEPSTGAAAVPGGGAPQSSETLDRVRAVWQACLGRGADGTGPSGKLRMYCLVVGYYLGFIPESERDWVLATMPFRRIGADERMLCAAFQRLECSTDVTDAAAAGPAEAAASCPRNAPDTIRPTEADDATDMADAADAAAAAGAPGAGM